MIAVFVSRYELRLISVPKRTYYPPNIDFAEPLYKNAPQEAPEIANQERNRVLLLSNFIAAPCSRNLAHFTISLVCLFSLVLLPNRFVAPLLVPIFSKFSELENLLQVHQGRPRTLNHALCSHGNEFTTIYSPWCVQKYL